MKAKAHKGARLPWTKTILLSILLSLFTGCGDSAVDGVKAGAIDGYPQGKVGDVFEANFDSASWSSEEKAGKRYVTFTGEISQALHSKADDTAIELMLRDHPPKAYTKMINAEADKFYDGKASKLSELDNNIASAKKELSEIDDKTFEKDMILQALKSSDPEMVAAAKKDAAKMNLPALMKRMDEIKTQLPVLQKQRNQLSQEVVAIQKTLTDKWPPIEEKIKAAYKEKYYWPVGSEVKFTWVIHANNEDFEIVEFTNDSWSKHGLDINFILRRVYMDK